MKTISKIFRTVLTLVLFLLFGWGIAELIEVLDPPYDFYVFVPLIVMNVVFLAYGIVTTWKEELLSEPPKDPYPQDPTKVYIVWCWEDIKSIRPKWSDEKCKQVLDRIGKYLVNRSIELGWEVMECLIGDLIAEGELEDE
jgi:hypothetical protein